MSSGEDFRIVDARAGEPDPVDLEAVVAHLAEGGIVAYPTETVYGFGCALRPDALGRLAELKERGPGEPFLLLLPDRAAVDDLRWTPEARELADVFWPGALTLILGDPKGAFPPEVRGTTGGVAVRRTPHPVARALVERLEAPLTSTSANAPGGIPAADAEGAAAAARAIGAERKEMWIVDGGRLPPSPPSTIVDLSGDAPRVLREGAVPVQRLACATSGNPEFWDPREASEAASEDP